MTPTLTPAVRDATRIECPHCGDRLELLAIIEDPKVIRRILSHLGLPTEVRGRTARAAAA